MFDNFQPIPDAESLPFYPLVLKLVVIKTQAIETPLTNFRQEIIADAAG